jgi:hypothetical protein
MKTDYCPGKYVGICYFSNDSEIQVSLLFGDLTLCAKKDGLVDEDFRDWVQYVVKNLLKEEISIEECCDKLNNKIDFELGLGNLYLYRDSYPRHGLRVFEGVATFAVSRI